MGTEAIETNDELEEIITKEADGEDADQTAETGVDFDKLVEGEGEPTSKPVPLISHLERVKKLNGKVDAAHGETERANLRAESLDEQNKLLRQQLLDKATLTRPKLNDFTSDEEYEAAKLEFDTQNMRTVIREETNQIFEANRPKAVPDNTENIERQKAHYDEAGKLGISNYVELEDNSISIFGGNTVREIINGVDYSEIVLPYLGHPKNRTEADKIANLFATGEHVKGLSKIAGLAERLHMKLKPKNSIAPDPETKVEGGSAVSQNDRKLDAMRDKVSKGEATMDDLMKLRRSLG